MKAGKYWFTLGQDRLSGSLNLVVSLNGKEKSVGNSDYHAHGNKPSSIRKSNFSFVPGATR